MNQPPPFKINGLSFRGGNSKPRPTPGVLSGAQLDGMEFVFRTYNDEQKEQIDALFTRETVTVEDPFSGRAYEATIHLDMTSYSPGEPETTYEGHVAEIDRAPHVDEIEIDGRRMRPLHYHEEAVSGVALRHALLRLSRDEIAWIRALMTAGTTTFKRVDIDDSPVPLQFVGRAYWSTHSDDGDVYYKQIINLAPPDFIRPPNPLSIIATAPDQEALQIGLVHLAMRFEALVNELNRGGALTDDAKARLISGNITPLIDKDRAEMIPWLTVRLDDAEEQFTR